jgi:hypothetical protein
MVDDPRPVPRRRGLTTSTIAALGQRCTIVVRAVLPVVVAVPFAAGCTSPPEQPAAAGTRASATDSAQALPDAGRERLSAALMEYERGRISGSPC